MNLTITEKPGGVRLELPEELNIQQVAGLHAALSPYAEKNLALEIEASRLRQTHSAIFQLFLVWKKSGFRVQWLNSSKEVTSFIQRLGLSPTDLTNN